MAKYETLHGEVKNALFTSYSLPWFDKRFKFKIDNIYFKKTLLDKIEAIEWIKDWNFVAIDTETNWKNLFWESLPFQFSWIKYENWKEVEKLNIFINVWKIPDVILELTHMDQKDINNWLDPKDAMYQIISFLKWEKVIFAHNAWFDISILNNLLVYTGIIDEEVLFEDILVRDSMQYFYFIYKHIYNCPVTWSSIEFLTKHFFLIDRDPNRAHQADYDCELLKNLLEKFNASIFLNKDYIISKIEEDEKRNEYIKYILKYSYDEKVITDLHNLWDSITDDYNEYLSLKERVDNYKTAIVNYLEKINWSTYSDSIIESFYVKKNIPFQTVKYRYLGSYKKENVVYSTPDWDLSFFLEENKDTFYTDIVIKTQKECLNVIEETTYLIEEMTNIQTKISNKLLIIKAHQEKTWYLNYWTLKAERRIETKYLDRTANHVNIDEDVEKWIVKTIEDLYEYRNYNTNLTIQLVWEWKDFEKVF